MNKIFSDMYCKAMIDDMTADLAAATPALGDHAAA